jgi:hypothetical protein
MDLDPKSAYAARRFFIPAAAAVLGWDMNEPLPLEDESVGVIFCVDAFHYVTEKGALAREFTRILFGKLEKAPALMLIVAKEANTLTTLPPTRTRLAAQASNPRLSDLYRAHRRDGTVIFERSLPPTLQDEYPTMDTILPPRWVSAAGAPSPPADQQDLLERNIFIDLPENY